MTGPSGIDAAQARAYGAYGERRGVSGGSRTAYTGQVAESETGWYLLGDRPYSPLLRRFLAPDPLSPFEAGGLGRYAYCAGDPVNYVDPSGNVRRRVTRPFEVDTTDSRVPSTSEAKGTSRTPSMTAASAAARVNTSEVLADIPSGSPASPSPPGNTVYGRISPDFSDSPIDQAAQSPRKKRRVDSQQERRVLVLHGKDIPEDRFKINKNGELDLKKNWIEKVHPGNWRSTVWAADTAISQRNLPKLLRILRWRGITKATLYTGSHGRPDGQNWTAGPKFERTAPEKQFVYKNLFAIVPIAKDYGIDLEVADIAELNMPDMIEVLAMDGVKIMDCCFGIADKALMEAFQITGVTVLDP